MSSQTDQEAASAFSWGNIATVVTTVLAIAGLLYPFGLLVQEQSLVASCNLDPSTARYAAQLVPKSIVVLQGVNELYDWPPYVGIGVVYIMFVVLLSVYDWIISKGHVDVNSHPLWSLIKYASNLLGVLAVLVYGNWLHFPTKATFIIIILITLIYTCLIKVFENFHVRWISLSVLLAFIASLFTAYYLSTPSDNLPLVSIKEHSGLHGLRISGGLLTHADGYWYVLVKVKPTGRLIPIADGSVASITIASPQSTPTSHRTTGKH